MVTADNPSSTPDASQQGVGARLLRSALRTPAFREIIHLHLSEGASTGGADLVRALLREDPALWLGLTSASPRVAEAVVQSLTTLGRELGALPESLVDAYLTQVVDSLDRETLRELPAVWTPLLSRALPGALALVFGAVAGVADTLADLPPEQRATALCRLLERVDPAPAAEALNAVAALVLTLQRERPALLPAGTGVDWGALLGALDLGRLRQATVALSAAGRGAAEEALGALLADPVAVANLVSLLPPLLNDGVGLVCFVLDELDLPEEVLASAVFNVLRALDVGALGRVIGRVATTVNTLHRGSAVLGAQEPAFLAVFHEILNGLLATLDVDAVARAAVAVGEDADVVARVLARRLVTDPALLVRGVDALVTLSDHGVQTTLQVIRELQHLDPEARQEVVTRLAALDGRALGELFNHGLALVEALWPASDTEAAWARGLRESLDTPRLRRLASRGVLALVGQAAAELWERYRADPAALGREVSRGLGRFNRAMEAEPQGLQAALSTALRAVDRQELSRAWRNLVRLVGRSVLPAGRAQGRRRAGWWRLSGWGTRG